MEAAGCLSVAPRRRRHLHIAAGLGRLPQPAQCAALHVALNAALFADPRFELIEIGPFVLAVRKEPVDELETVVTARLTRTFPRQLQSRESGVRWLGAARLGNASTPVARAGHEPSDRPARPPSSRGCSVRAGDRGSPAAGETDHRAAELAAERRARSAEAPLIGYVATDLNIAMPCQAAAGLAGPENKNKTVLLSTVPKQAPKAVDRGLLIERVNDDLLVIVRNIPVVSAPLGQVLSPACQRLVFTAHADRVIGEFVGLMQGPQQPSRRSRRTAARRTQRVRLPAADRRGLHRPGRTGPAGPGVLGDPRHPLQQLADALEDARDVVGVALTVVALGRAAHPGHRRRHAASDASCRRAGGR